MYNRIPNKIMEAGKMRQFKRALRSYLVHTAYVLLGRGIYVKIFVLRIVCLQIYVSSVSNLTKRKNKELN
jgi:hypothetical protein